MNQEHCTPKRQKFKHLNKYEREIIGRKLATGTTKAEIARVLGRNISTIKREIKRGTVIQKKENPYYSKNPDIPDYIYYNKYFADTGQSKYEKARKNCGAKSKLLKCIEFVKYAEKMILSEKKWSPDTVVGYAKLKNKFDDMPSTKTVYNWIELGLMKVKNIDLHLKLRRKPKSKPKERKKILGKSIDERPKEVDNRQEFGHWEGDGIVGANQQGHLITLVERKTDTGIIFDVKDKKSCRIVDVLAHLKQRFGECYDKAFKTITFDNGSEFSRSDQMENITNTSIYYAHPYSSWERGINENWNGMVRRFLPKGSSFVDLDKDFLDRIAHYINTMPRKRIGYLTSLDLWNKELTNIASI